MNKLFLITFFKVTICFSQFGQQVIISTEAALARSVFAADLDGDNDIDVLSASKGDDKVAWYENIGGQGNFGSQKIISQSLVHPADAYASDLDGDNDMDILVASRGVSQYESKVVWYENVDGLGNFSDYIIISEQVEGAIAVFATDLDGDEDIDILSASMTDNKVAWYENIDGQGNFGVQQIITNTAWSTRDVFAADLDGDNDMDVLTVSLSTAEVIWFENTDGLGNFGPKQTVASDVISVLSVHASDIDGDNDLDVLVAEPYEQKLTWFENTDGEGNFGAENIIVSNQGEYNQVFAIDLDNDNDMDVISSLPNLDKIAWYENLDGNGNFGLQQIISDETDYPRSIAAADIDGDGDNDVLSASFVDNKIAWYKNFTLFVADLEQNSISIYPNPTVGLLFIESDVLKINSITFFDILGKKILSQNKDLYTIDVSHFDRGVYLLELDTDSGKILEKIIKN